MMATLLRTTSGGAGGWFPRIPKLSSHSSSTSSSKSLSLGESLSELFPPLTPSPQPPPEAPPQVSTPLVVKKKKKKDLRHQEEIEDEKVDSKLEKNRWAAKEVLYLFVGTERTKVCTIASKINGTPKDLTSPFQTDTQFQP